MSSSIPDALDYLTTEVRGLAVVQAAKVIVSDGWPAQRGDQMIAFGVTPEEDDAGVSISYAELSREEYETVEVPSIAFARAAGSTAASAARRQAYVLFDAINELIRADRRLGGAVNPGLPARIVRSDVSQTADVQQAGEGRVCEVRFVIGWQHRG